MKEHFNANYLMQVWTREGKLYQKALKYDIHCWNIFFNFFLFKLNPQEDGSEFIYVVRLDKESAVLKIKDLVNDLTYVHMGVNQDLLYYASEKTILVCDIRILDIDNAQTKEFTIAKEDIATYQITGDNRLLNLFENVYSKNDTYIMCAVETEDCQMDFTRLYFWSRDIKVADLEFYQYREVVPRQLRNDPIAKFDQVILENDFQFGLALRKSGNIDFYWNFTFVAHSKDGSYQDVDATFDYLYIQRKNGERLKIDTEWDSRIGLDVMEEFSISQENYIQVFYQMIKRDAKLVNSFCQTATYMFVAHHNVVSIFDFYQDKWTNHFFFDEDVYIVLRNAKPGEYSFYDKVYNAVVFLKSGAIKIVDFTGDIRDANFMVKEIEGKIDGKLLNCVSDSRDVTSHYLLCQSKSQKQIYMFEESLLTLLADIKVQDSDKMMVYSSKNDELDFILFDIEQGKGRIFQNSFKTVTLYQEFKLKIDQGQSITSDVHCCISTNNEDQIVILDYYDFYLINIKESTMEVFKNYRIKNVCQIDQDFYYSLNEQSKNREKPGFYFQNFNNIITSKEDRNFQLQNSLVGINSDIDYNKENERLSYLVTYDLLTSVPLLHRNIIQFIGMNSRENYIVFKRDKDQLIALGKDGYLTTWSAVTGKILFIHKLKQDLDVKGWAPFARDPQDYTWKIGWYFPKVFLQKTEAIEGYDENKFFDKSMVSTSLTNNTPYMKIVQKTFHEFRVLEILSSTDVKIHIKFIHPQYQDSNYHRIYFSDNLQYMLERLINQRVFLYKQESVDEEGFTKWKMVKRLLNFPKDISEVSYHNFLFSPDLMFYLDFDKSKEVFLIKRTLTQEPYCVIPKGLMNPNKEVKELIAKKFKWVSNDKIKLVNNEGIEKVLDISAGFQEKAYGTVPLFDIDEIKSKQGHFYYQSDECPLNATKKRLVKKYIEYKSAYDVDKKRGEALNEILFSTDFAVEKGDKKCVIEMAFTFLLWKRIRSMTGENKRFNFKLISIQELKMLVMNILPKCQTVLHYAEKNFYVTRKIFQIAQKERKLLYPDGKPHLFEIPFIRDINGCSPLHKCFETKNYKAADIIFQNLSNEPLDSHGRAIVDIIPQAILNELPSLGDYMNSRFIQTDQIKEIRKGKLKVRSAAMNYAIGSSQLWTDTKFLERQLLMESPLDAEIKLQFLDIPLIHVYREPISDEFFEALGGVSQDYFNIFGQPSIQAIIDFKWPLVRDQTIKVLFIPFLFYHVIFLVYSNVFFYQYEYDDQMDIANYVLSALLLAFSLYFLVNELRQLISSGLDYLKSFWNYSDLIPPILIIALIGVHLKYGPQAPHVLTSVHSVACLLMWTKFLYFLRIFRQTGYFIRMLTDVIYDMKIFLFILLIVYMAFAEAFLRISEASLPRGQYVSNYIQSIVFAYDLSLGNADTGMFEFTNQSVYVWVIYVICGILTSIVMLNLLIAIISEAFAKINENIILANYQERARIISENSYMIPMSKKIAACPRKHYLVVAREVVEEGDKEATEEIGEKITSLEEQFTLFKTEIASKLDEIIAKGK